MAGKLGMYEGGAKFPETFNCHNKFINFVIFTLKKYCLKLLSSNKTRGKKSNSCPSHVCI